MKNRCITAVLLIAGIASGAFAGIISGTIVDSLNDSIANATITLKSSGADTFSSINGQFALSIGSTATILRQVVPTNSMKLDGSRLIFAVKTNERLRVDLYTLQGRRIGSAFDRTFGEGVWSLPLSSFMGRGVASGVIMMKITKGSEQLVHIEEPMGSGSMVQGRGGAMQATSLAAGSRGVGAVRMSAVAAAALDSLIVTDLGYLPAAVPLASYTTQSVGAIVIHLTPVEFAVRHSADSLLALMTNAQKAGQMTEVQLNNSAGNGSGGRLTNAQVASMCIGSVFNGGSELSSARPAILPQR